MTNTPTPRVLKKTVQRKLPNQREMDREKLNRGGAHHGDPKRHDGQSDNSSRGNHHRGDTTNDNYK